MYLRFPCCCGDGKSRRLDAAQSLRRLFPRDANDHGLAQEIRHCATTRLHQLFCRSRSSRTEEHVHTGDCWADMGMDERPANKQWTEEVVDHDREVAYAKGKAEAERYVYDEAEKMCIAAFGVCPCHVIGPPIGANHQRP